MDECVFCRVIRNRKGKVLFENDKVIAILNIHPVSKGYTLIIPKRHVETPDRLTEEEWHAVFEAFKTVKSLLDEIKTR
ncbi:MAG: HIT domain-containing protein [Candidatus Aenigmarchaeota archaeon]|nr:HIT domain-containing protein [Candidatus Aenigmarchaeota archaeon]